MKSLLSYTLSLALLLLLPGELRPPAQERTSSPAAPPTGFPDLVTPLRAIPGCLGVETARTESGKNVIFAWFEDKAAALRWYRSETHVQAMKAFTPDLEHEEEPMSEVPDEVGPILAIASITFTSEPELDSVALPVSQISIELYTPLEGGLSLGGRFAPPGLVVPKRKVIVEQD